MKRNKPKAVKRGGVREAGAGSVNREPVRTDNSNFSRTARKVHPLNKPAMVMRGGIRL